MVKEIYPGIYLNEIPLLNNPLKALNRASNGSLYYQLDGFNPFQNE